MKRIRIVDRRRRPLIAAIRRLDIGMPFENHGNRAFTVISIVKNAPQGSGVYGLADSHQWIYVGEALDIQAELLRHLREPHAFLTEHPPSGFTYELTDPDRRIDRQNQLVFELEPIGNRLVGQLSKWTSSDKMRGSHDY